MIAPLKGTTNAVFAGKFVKAEHRWNDWVVAEGVDMGVAFVAGQKRYQNAAEDTCLGGSVVTRVSEGAFFHPSFPKAAGLQELNEIDEGPESGDFGFGVPEHLDPTAEGVQLGVLDGRPEGGFEFTLWVSGTARGGLRHPQYCLSLGGCCSRQTAFNCRK